MTSSTDRHSRGAEVVPGTLYVVATPIGHLADLSPRAVAVLNGVDVIAAEDTRHSQRLKKMHTIATPMVPYHQHNEQVMSQDLVRQLQQQRSVALISDAGTPLINDPGHVLLQAAIAAGVTISPIPGPCAAIAALSVAGLPTQGFAFYGFLPHKSSARTKQLQQWVACPHVVVFYEAPHRLAATIADMLQVYGAERKLVAAVELTKRHERIHRGSIHDLHVWCQSLSEQPKGEWVLVLGESHSVRTTHPEIQRTLSVLMTELPLKQAVALTCSLCEAPRNQVYQMAIEQQNNSP
jgi:16S rRNA (cytidine1402-2'-O)-methyltransferase